MYRDHPTPRCLTGALPLASAREQLPDQPAELVWNLPATAHATLHLAPEHAPDPEVVNRQGLPGAGTVDYGWPAVVRLEADDLMAAVVQVREVMTDQVPGVITVTLPDP